MLRLVFSCGHQGESESFGSVPDAVSPALEAGPRMPMRDVTEHEKETARARRGLLSTLHVDIETSCKRLQHEAAAGGLAVQVELGDLETRSKSWRVRPSAPGVVKARPEKASKWIKLTERKCLTGQGRLIRRPRNSARE